MGGQSYPTDISDDDSRFTEDGSQGSKNGGGETSEEITATVQERNHKILHLISGVRDGADRGRFMVHTGIRSRCTEGGYGIREGRGSERKLRLTPRFPTWVAK